MRRIVAAFSLLGFCAVVAIAQPPSVDTSTGPAGPSRLEPVSPSRPVRVPLTATELEAIGRRLAAYRAHLLAETPRAADLIRSGLSKTTDAVERASETQPGKIGPIHIGVLTPLPAPSAADVDPALAAGARATLHARLGREPSPAELGAELEEFDARIARMNEALLVRRAEIARSIRSAGKFPLALERRILGVAGASEPPNPERVEEGFQILIRSLLLDEIDPRPPGTPRVSPLAPSVPRHPAPARPERVLDPR